MKWLALKTLRFYKRFISPILPAACLYQPTCSEYMYEAIQIHGVWKGVRLGLKRLWRCQPMLYKGNPYDPVPPKESSH